MVRVLFAVSSSLSVLSSPSYTKRSYRVSSALYIYIDSITQGLSNPEFRLFCHLLLSTVKTYRALHKNGNSGWLPLPKRFIQDKFRTAIPGTLQLAQLIDIDPQYFVKSRSMRYRVKPWVLNGYLSRLLINSNPQDDYNLISRKLWVKDCSIKQDNKTVSPLPKDTPPLIQEAISRFTANYYCRPQVLSHLEDYLRRVSTDETGKWNLKLTNDLCVFHVVDHDIENKEGEICSYTPEYTLQ